MYESSSESLLRQFKRLRLITIPLVALVGCNILVFAMGCLMSTQRAVDQQATIAGTQARAMHDDRGGSVAAVVEATGGRTETAEIESRKEDAIAGDESPMDSLAASVGGGQRCSSPESANESAPGAVWNLLSAVARKTNATLAEALLPQYSTVRALQETAAHHDWYATARQVLPEFAALGPSSDGELISLRNEGPIPVSFLWNNRVETLEAGEVRFVENALSANVRFHRGGEFGEAQTTVTSGSYCFEVGPRGWELNRID